jgi:SAM-dependent MidA family methyltransferase
MFSDLPRPDPSALEHSAKLVELLQERIAAGGGWLSFAAYMDLALYAPGLGYYSAGAHKFGAAGDFVTAPEISPLFSRCLGQQCAEVLGGLDGGSILELGAGSGSMAAEMLLELERLQQLPDEYLILERGADLRERQQTMLQECCAHLLPRVRWLDSEPQSFRGVIVGNELIDALPVNLFHIAAEGLQETGVAMGAETLVFVPRPASPQLLAATADIPGFAALPAGYSSEISLRLPAFIAEISGWLTSGVIMLMDYGFSRPEYYLPERTSGTLRCYYRHRAHEDALLWPGLQDITAWVDFTLLAESALAAGMEVAGYTTQAQFLLAAGLEARLADMAGNDPREQVEQASALRQLLLPGEMGEAIKVIALTKGQADAPGGFAGRDMRSSL